MDNTLNQLEKEAIKRINGVYSVPGLETVRVKYLGRKCELTLLLKSLYKLSESQRKTLGSKANALKQELEVLIKNKKILLEKGIIDEKLTEDWTDITQQGVKKARGHLHPVTQVMEEIKSIFKTMGYEIAQGPEVENDYYNFEGLNIPKEHPARDAWDTFWLKNGLLMRTHTSPVQIRAMEGRKPPLRIIAPGRTYRYEAEDATHLSIFNQIEGFAVDENISFSDLKGTLEHLMKSLLGEKTRLKFRPSFFPFTEPSAEVDVSCFKCGGKGCRTCGGDGWIELLGAGMIHPQVLRNVGYDPEKYSGFAFGLGPERIAMLKYEVDDIREFMKGDLRFLNQF
ncbi:phenylalanine--tRNA ligase subunit alpha [bacterium]|nr:phenylalanine--tRNA ligase subunit alpha [bacterium]